MSVGRKRLRSDESFVGQQTKFYVNQKIIDSRDSEKMKYIYDKTREMLYKGAKLPLINANNDFKSFILSGTGTVSDSYGKPTVTTDIISVSRECKSCTKMSAIHADCANCNLESCEFCGFSCGECRSLLCFNCINLFNCGTFEKPCCEQCKLFRDF